MNIKYLLFLLIFFLFCKKYNIDVEAENVSNLPGRSEYPSIVVDSKGILHVVWVEDLKDGEKIMYSFKKIGEPWSKPVILGEKGRYFSLVIDKNDNLHLAWQHFIGFGWVICYQFKPLDGEWSQPEIIATGLSDVDPTLTVDEEGNLYMIWQAGGYYSYLFFSMKKGETWTMPETITPRGGIGDKVIAVDILGNAHIVYDYFFPNTYDSDLYYISRDQNGNWSKPILLYDTTGLHMAGTGMAIASDKEGNTHLIYSKFKWEEGEGIKHFYRIKLLRSNWSEPETIPVGIPISIKEIEVDNLQTIYLLYSNPCPSLRYKKKGRKWSKVIEVRPLSVRYSDWPSMAIYNDEIHIVFSGGEYEKEEIYYMKIKKP